jgi:hypothetical protein
LIVFCVELAAADKMEPANVMDGRDYTMRRRFSMKDGQNSIALTQFLGKFLPKMTVLRLDSANSCRKRQKIHASFPLSTSF